MISKPGGWRDITPRERSYPDPGKNSAENKELFLIEQRADRRGNMIVKDDFFVEEKRFSITGLWMCFSNVMNIFLFLVMNLK